VTNLGEYDFPITSTINVSADTLAAAVDTVRANVPGEDVARVLGMLGIEGT